MSSTGVVGIDFDVEIETMKLISDALMRLDSGAQERVVAWVTDRFTAASVARRPSYEREAGEFAPSVSVKGTQQDFLLFSHAAELFEAAQPKTDAEKALVIGYWFQACQSNTVFAARQVNDELKHIGYGVGNITRALDSLTNIRPALAIQLEKSGRSQQAQKKFKLTHEGVKRVQQLLEGGGAQRPYVPEPTRR